VVSQWQLYRVVRQQKIPLHGICNLSTQPLNPKDPLTFQKIL